jgi:DHA1 family bicyclomycin/chloramphenicol resistance-like MFS transporter
LIREPRALVPLLAACSTTGPVATNLFLPALPVVGTGFGVSVPAVQSTVSAYLIAFAVGILVFGPLADRHGRRPAIVGGMGIFALGSALALAAPTLGTLVAARLVQGFGAGAGITVARATVGDLYEGPELARKIALLTMAMVLGTVLSPWFGGVLAEAFGWRSGFLLMAIAGAAIVLACARLLPETRPAHARFSPPAELARQARAVLARPVFFGYVIQAGVIYAVFLVFISVAPHLMVGVLDRPVTDFGLYYIVLSVGYFLGNYYVSSRAHRADVDRLIVVGLGLQVAGAAGALAAVLAGCWHPLLIFGPMFPLSIGQGLALPNITARAVSLAPGYAGVASSLIGFSQQAIAAISVQAMGFASTASPFPVTLFCFATSAIALASVFVLRENRRA